MRLYMGTRTSGLKTRYRMARYHRCCCMDIEDMVKTEGLGGDDSDKCAPTTTTAPSDKLLADDVEEDAFLLVQLEVIFPSSMPK